MTHLPRLIFAAPMSGSGKTTITAGIIAALVTRGHRVAPFKCGPDYIDPTYHTLAANRPASNLDAWLTPPHYIPSLLVQHAANSDIAIIEGVMGLFDGYADDALGEEADIGSTAHIARLTASPVILILDVRGMARTAAALIAGLQAFDPRLNIVGVILNRVGSTRHAQMVKQAIESTTNLPVLGYLLRETALTLPERHLGLVPTTEATEEGEWSHWLQALRAQIESSIDLDRLVALAAGAPQLPLEESSLPTFPSSHLPKPTIAVARDAAFSFHYQDNLGLLEAAGAKIAYFSPMHDSDLPPSTHAIYLCGGFPELYAASLSKNSPMLNVIRKAASDGIPIYAECGGLIYLTEAVVTGGGKSYPLVGLLSGKAVMKERVTLGYRTVQALADNWLLHAGESIRGHEFHYSIWEQVANGSPCLYEIQPSTFLPNPRLEGVQKGNVLASYIHLHFLATPHLASRFVETARAAMDSVSSSFQP